MAIACEAWNGSSEGLVICLPDAACIWLRVSFSETELRSASTLRWTIEVVMRMLTARPSRCG